MCTPKYIFSCLEFVSSVLHRATEGSDAWNHLLTRLADMLQQLQKEILVLEIMPKMEENS